MSCRILPAACILAAALPLPRTSAAEPLELALPSRELAVTSLPAEVQLSREDARTWQSEPEPRDSFYRGRLLPRMERQFGRVSQYRWAAQVNPTPADSMLQEEVTEIARKSLERATQRAIEDYLIEETALRFVALSLDRRSRQANPEGTRRVDALRLGVGISHGLPELELRARIGTTEVKFELDTEGRLGVGYRSPRSGRADVFARFEPNRSSYSLNTRFSY